MHDSLRLRQYRFPAGHLSPEDTPQSDGGFFDTSCYPSSDSDSTVAFTPPLIGSHNHAKRSTSEELDTSIICHHHSRERPVSGASFDTVGFLDSYSCRTANSCKSVGDAVSEGEINVAKLPESPPPAYVEYETVSNCHSDVAFGRATRWSGIYFQ